MSERIEIEKLVDGGQGLGYLDNQVVFVWNVLPGEEVEIDIIIKRKGIYEGRVKNILQPSPHRSQPDEDHFLSCSPWSIMDFDYENQQKREIAKENLRRIGKLEENDIEALDIQIFSDNQISGYRNKMEFSFVESDSKISLAFFSRGGKKRIAINGCELANAEIQKTAENILSWINKNGLTERNLKALIIRSNRRGEVVAGLFIKDKIVFDKYPELDESLLGFNLYYSTHKSPASVITDVLYKEGQDFLIEEIGGKKFKYGINSFFQVNIPVFEMALKDIAGSIGACPPNRRVDFYSGVGAIGLSVGSNTLIESNEEAVSFAKENIALNKAKKTEAILAPSEKVTDFIDSGKVVIFDPPRAGLHQDVVDRILEKKPGKIIYLSCNTATQSRDIGLLKGIYDIKSIRLYNFFPRTPHIESLCVLELKKQNEKS